MPWLSGHSSTRVFMNKSAQRMTWCLKWFHTSRNLIWQLLWAKTMHNFSVISNTEFKKSLLLHSWVMGRRNVFTIKYKWSSPPPKASLWSVKWMNCLTAQPWCSPVVPGSEPGHNIYWNSPQKGPSELFPFWHHQSQNSPAGWFPAHRVPVNSSEGVDRCCTYSARWRQN